LTYVHINTQQHIHIHQNKSIKLKTKGDIATNLKIQGDAAQISYLMSNNNDDPTATATTTAVREGKGTTGVTVS